MENLFIFLYPHFSTALCVIQYIFQINNRTNWYSQTLDCKQTPSGYVPGRGTQDSKSNTPNCTQVLAQSQPDPVPAAMWQENGGWTEGSRSGVSHCRCLKKPYAPHAQGLSALSPSLLSTPVLRSACPFLNKLCLLLVLVMCPKYHLSFWDIIPWNPMTLELRSITQH